MTEVAGKKVILNNIAISAIDKNVLSAEEFLKEQQTVEMYPNPTKDQINIFSDKRVDKVLVYNIFGKLVYKSSKNHNSTTLDLSSFSKGIYLVKVFSEGVSTTQKIIKE
jgi:hypothetical protein